MHEYHIEEEILWVFQNKLEWTNEWSLERTIFEIYKQSYLFTFCGAISLKGNVYIDLPTTDLTSDKIKLYLRKNLTAAFCDIDG